jgi:hypothetical protein
MAPRWRLTQLIAGVILPRSLALLYLVTLATALTGGAEGGFGSLAGVASLFCHSMALLAG